MRRISEVEDELSLEGEVLRSWIEQRWIRPTMDDGEPLFDEADMARARLIAELRQDFNVTDEAMPVVLTEPEEWEAWLTAPWPEAKGLQRPLPDGSLKIVLRGVEPEDTYAV